MGIGAFKPLQEFLNKANWKGAVDEYTMSNGILWRTPITLAILNGRAKSLLQSQETALGDAGPEPKTVTPKIQKLTEMEVR